MSVSHREAVISWGGEEYTLKANMALLCRIDGQLMRHDQTALTVVNATLRGKPPVPMMAVIMGEIMRAAGIKVSDDDLYADLMARSGNEQVTELFNAVIALIVPPGPPEGNGNASDALQKAPGAKRKKPKG